jgi:cation:H+ antiporter
MARSSFSRSSPVASLSLPGLPPHRWCACLYTLRLWTCPNTNRRASCQSTRLPGPGDASLTLAAVLFLAAAAVIGVVGTRLTGVADALAERMGLGETLVGAVLLGASTSLSGIVTSVTVAAGSSAELAVSNAVGGIAAQTFVLAVADAFYTRANLEHAAASPTNLAQGALLITLLAIPLMAFAGPEISFWGVHPATPLLLGAYLLGLRMISKAQTQPIWQATRTSETQIEEEQEESEQGDFDDVGTRLL